MARDVMERGVVRHTDDAEAQHPPQSYRGRKNRRKWCRGRQGEEHILAWQTHHGWKRDFSEKQRRWIEVEACQRCGKLFDYRWNDGERWQRRVRKGKL